MHKLLLIGLLLRTIRNPSTLLATINLCINAIILLLLLILKGLLNWGMLMQDIIWPICC